MFPIWKARKEHQKIRGKHIKTCRKCLENFVTYHVCFRNKTHKLIRVCFNFKAHIKH
jgi:hypothetical protein